ncbi:hypothetical protein HY504_00425 [Candidatus Wolfebacteria bacterium]|nr:hypothetical protein [Candidatus Wolfebacteria bacterium]
MVHIFHEGATMALTVEQKLPVGRFKGFTVLDLQGRYSRYLLERECLEGVRRRDAAQEQRLADLAQHLMPNLAEAIRGRGGELPEKPAVREKKRSRRGTSPIRTRRTGWGVSW